ncbi:hypothetical protein ACQ4PT_016434 [Festuca glaucescens]
MAWGQVARRPIASFLSRAQQQAAQVYTCSATSQTHLLSNHFPQNGMLHRRFSSEVPASEQMSLIKQLRERTSAPIKDVKASLVSCNWDIEEAQKDLRKRGVILAAKKSSRTAAEGLLAMAQDEKRAAVVELNCETDFVARNEVFQYLVGFTLSNMLSIVQYIIIMLNCVSLGRMAGLVTLVAEDSTVPLDALKRVGSSIAMHIVAQKPLFLSKELVSAAAIESERDVLRTQAEKSGKPPMAMEKMVEGRLRKYFEEVVLLEQKYVVNDSTNIKTLLNDLSKEVGSEVTIGNFVRMEVGEGIERPEEADVPEAKARAA